MRVLSALSSGDILCLYIAGGLWWKLEENDVCYWCSLLQPWSRGRAVLGSFHPARPQQSLHRYIWICIHFISSYSVWCPPVMAYEIGWLPTASVTELCPRDQRGAGLLFWSESCWHLHDILLSARYILTLCWNLSKLAGIYYLES